MFDAELDRCRSATPFLHNGCAPTLRDRFGVCGGGEAHGRTAHLTQEQISIWFRISNRYELCRRLVTFDDSQKVEMNADRQNPMGMPTIASQRILRAIVDERRRALSRSLHRDRRPSAQVGHAAQQAAHASRSAPRTNDRAQREACSARRRTVLSDNARAARRQHRAITRSRGEPDHSVR